MYVFFISGVGLFSLSKSFLNLGTTKQNKGDEPAYDTFFSISGSPQILPMMGHGLAQPCQLLFLAHKVVLWRGCTVIFCSFGWYRFKFPLSKCNTVITIPVIDQLLQAFPCSLYIPSLYEFDPVCFLISIFLIHLQRSFHVFVHGCIQTLLLFHLKASFWLSSCQVSPVFFPNQLRRQRAPTSCRCIKCSTNSTSQFNSLNENYISSKICQLTPSVYCIKIAPFLISANVHVWREVSKSSQDEFCN